MAAEDDSEVKQLDPSQKRLDQALERGDVVKSQEINTWFVIAGATLVLSNFGGSLATGIMVPMRNLLANAWMINVDGPGLMQLAKSLIYAVVSALGMPLFMLMLAAVAANLVQHRLVWSGEPLKPSF